jgi:hypothetical protein
MPQITTLHEPREIASHHYSWRERHVAHYSNWYSGATVQLKMRIYAVGIGDVIVVQ